MRSEPQIIGFAFAVLTPKLSCLIRSTPLFLKGVVSTASTATSNPLPTLYCYDITGSNDRGG